MKVAPRYRIPPGSEITLLGRPMVVTGQDEQGYTVVGSEDGASTVVSYAKLVEHFKLPGATIDTALPLTGGRAKDRLGGFATSVALSEEQLRIGRFHCALCEGVRAYRAKLRIDHGDPDLYLSERMADVPEARKFIARFAEQVFGEPIRLRPDRGGKAKGMIIYKGKTLIKYFKAYESLEPNELPIDALVPLDHLKGNQTPRIYFQLRELMTEAWEKIGFDTRCRYVSNVKEYLETKIWEVNQIRKRNGVAKLVVPAHGTLTKHRDSLLNPTELMVATKGIREARNKRGRGSTDIRALLVGEIVEIDECKISRDFGKSRGRVGVPFGRQKGRTRAPRRIYQIAAVDTGHGGRRHEDAAGLGDCRKPKRRSDADPFSDGNARQGSRETSLRM